MLTDTGDRFDARGPVPPLAIPTSLQASLLARLDRLAPVREMAQIGAALGRSFSHELISAVAAMPQQQVNGALARLVDAELVFQRGTPPDAEYTFKHALVQDAAPCCAVDASRSMPALRRRWRASSLKSWPLSRNSWPTIAPRPVSTRRRSATG